MRSLCILEYIMMPIVTSLKEYNILGFEIDYKTLPNQILKTYFMSLKCFSQFSSFFQTVVNIS